MIPALKISRSCRISNEQTWMIKTNQSSWQFSLSIILLLVFQIQDTICNHWKGWISPDISPIIQWCGLGIRKPIYYSSSLQVSSVPVSIISYNLGTVNILWGSDVCQGHCLSLWLSSLISFSHPSKRQAQPWGERTPTHAPTPTYTHACAHTA